MNINIDKLIKETNEYVENGFMFLADVKTIKEVHYKVIELDGVKLKVHTDGIIYRWYKNNGEKQLKNPYWKKIENVASNKLGYNQIVLNNKKFTRHRIMCYSFKKLDINNTKKQIDHIDGDRINNNIDNLRIVSHQHNHFNRTKAKGYYFDKQRKQWRSTIKSNDRAINLGSFTTEEQARNAYLEAKKIYHIIPNN